MKNQLHRKSTLFLLLGMLLFSEVNAQIITDRPDQTEASSTIPKGSFQIETGILHEENKNTKGFFTPTTLFRYGLTKSIEIRFVNQYESNTLTEGNFSTKEKGFSNLEIGTKIQLLKKEGIGTEIAFLTHLILPIGGVATSESDDKFGTINKLSISHFISNKFSLGYNIGYDYFNAEKGNITYSLALGTSITEKLGFYIEPYGALEELKSHVSNFDFGFTYLLKENLQLDISYGKGLSDSMQYFSTGFSWNI